MGYTMFALLRRLTGENISIFLKNHSRFYVSYLLSTA